jgi:transcriptional regulator with XRE-family HTH domain
MKDLNSIIGKNIKVYRNRLRLSFEQLSQLSNVSKGMLCQIEKGESNPSINTVYKISNALNIPISAIITEPVKDTIIVDCNDLTPVCNEDKSFKVYTMFPSTESNNFEVLYVTFNPGGAMYSEKHLTDTKEHILVYSGELLLRINGQEYNIKEKQGICFTADVPHSYHNVIDKKLIFTNTIFYERGVK